MSRELLGCVLYFAVALGAALGVSPKGAPKNIELRYTMPESVKVGETFAMTLTVSNGATATQKLYSLDIDTHFLNGVSIVETRPTETKRMKPLFGVDREVRSRNDLTAPALLEIPGNATNQELIGVALGRARS